MKKLGSLLIIFFLSHSIQAQVWEQTTGPVGGYIYCLTADGANIYAGTNAGIFLSKDYGINWLPVSNGIKNCLFVEAIAAVGANVIAATDYGVYYSNDTANNWNPAITNIQAHDLTVIGNNIFAGTPVGIYKSTDYGSTWVPSNNGVPCYWPDYLDVFCFAHKDTCLFAGVEHGICRSSDTGASWMYMSSVFSNSDVTALTTTNSYLFAGTNNSGVYRSNDNGINWIAVNSGLTSAYITSLVVLDTIIYAGTTNGVFLSMDYGSNWTAVNNGLTELTVRALATIDTILFAGTGNSSSYPAGYSPFQVTGSVFSSTNKGNSWAKISTGMPDLSVQSLAIIGNEIFAGTVDGIFKSSDNGLTWVPQNTGLTSLQVNSLFSDGSYLYAGTQSQGIFVSNDSGLTWLTANNGLSPYANSSIRCFAKQNNVLFAGTQGGVFYSTAGGSWAPVNSCGALSILPLGSKLLTSFVDGLSVHTYNGNNWVYASSPQELMLKNVTSLAQINNNVFAGCYGNGVFVSSDSGATWTAINNGLNNFNVYCLNSIGTILLAGTSGGVYVTSDYGNNWSALNVGLSNMHTYAITTNGTNIFSGTNASVWKNILPTSVRFFKNKTLVDLYPNPTAGELNFVCREEVSSLCTMLIKNALGQTVYSKIYSGLNTNISESIDLSTFPKGIYFVELASSYNELKEIKKIIIR